MVFKSRRAERMFYARAVVRLAENGFACHIGVPDGRCCTACYLANGLVIVLADKADALLSKPTQNA